MEKKLLSSSSPSRRRKLERGDSDARDESGTLDAIDSFKVLSISLCARLTCTIFRKRVSPILCFVPQPYQNSRLRFHKTAPTPSSRRHECSSLRSPPVDFTAVKRLAYKLWSVAKVSSDRLPMISIQNRKRSSSKSLSIPFPAISLHCSPFVTEDYIFNNFAAAFSTTTATLLLPRKRGMSK